MGGGESYTELQTRVKECISEIAKKHKNKHILVVSTSQNFKLDLRYKSFEVTEILL
jgi:broad specificity phosphatase PhoE